MVRFLLPQVCLDLLAVAYQAPRLALHVCRPGGPCRQIDPFVARYIG